MNPLGHTLTNVFLCHHDKRRLNDCPIEFKPVWYKRYIDDSFVLFRDLTHVSKFLKYLNDKHPDIKFSSEIEENNLLSFLDVEVKKTSTSFEISVFRKKTFTNLGMRYDSFLPVSYKLDLFTCLVKRVFKICSSDDPFAAQLTFLKNYFTVNLFPMKFIQKQFCKALVSIYNVKPKISTVERKAVYINLPFCGPSSFRTSRKLLYVVKDSTRSSKLG
jgi:hypothetical protein